MSAQSTSSSKPQGEESLWVLSHPIQFTAPAPEPAPAAIPAQVDPHVFADALHAFASTLSNALVGIPWGAGNFELDEVTFQANFSADVGFILIGGVAVEGAVGFKYVRNPNTLPMAAPGS